MSVTVSTSPELVLPARPARLTFTADSGNFVRVWCTAAPAGSKLRQKLDAIKARPSPELLPQRVHAFDADSGEPIYTSFEIGGAYQFVATELKKGAAPYGGGFQGAPNTYRSEDILGETALTVWVGSRITSKLGTGADAAKLVLYVFNDYVRSTTLATHGEATPAITEVRSDRASLAAETPAVLDALANLAGRSAAELLGGENVGPVLSNLIDRFNAHREQAGVHPTDDTDHVISSAFRGASNESSLKQGLSALQRNLGAHVSNDSSAGVGSASYHLAGDLGNAPLAIGASRLAEVAIGMADAWRCYEAHRVSAAHVTPDMINAANDLPRLLELHSAFIGEIAKQTPTTPITENEARAVLVAAGFQDL